MYKLIFIQRWLKNIITGTTIIFIVIFLILFLLSSFSINYHWLSCQDTTCIVLSGNCSKYLIAVRIDTKSKILSLSASSNGQHIQVWVKIPVKYWLINPYKMHRYNTCEISCANRTPSLSNATLLLSILVWKIINSSQN